MHFFTALVFAAALYFTSAHVLRVWSGVAFKDPIPTSPTRWCAALLWGMFWYLTH